MSRIGKRTLIIPDNVSIDVNDNKVTVKGPKGELSLDLVNNIEVKVEDKNLTVEKKKEDKNKFYSETKLKYYRRKAMNKKFGRKR